MHVSIRDRDQLEEKEKYPALRVLIAIWKVIAIIGGAGAVIVGIIATIDQIKAEESRGPTGVAIVIVGALTALAIWAQAEIVEVLLDIERNTRKS